MLEAFGITDPGCVRANNEDYYLLAKEQGLYLVADGMGGAQAGEHASKLAADTVKDFIAKAAHADADVLAQAFEEANRQVIDAASQDAELEGMGTTLVAALESGPELLIASVGDSRAYVYTGEKLSAVTEDQTWVHEIGRRLGIDEGSLKTHPMRHVLTMAIGVSPTGAGPFLFAQAGAGDDDPAVQRWAARCDRRERHRSDSGRQRKPRIEMQAAD